MLTNFKRVFAGARHRQAADLMRPDCYLVLDGGKVKSFSDATGRELRQGHNIEKMYRNGEFDE